MTLTMPKTTPTTSERANRKRAGQLAARIARAKLDINQWEKDLAALQNAPGSQPDLPAVSAGGGN